MDFHISTDKPFWLLLRKNLNFPGEACPWTPLVCHMLYTQISTYLPKNNLILPLGQQAETNPVSNLIATF